MSSFLSQKQQFKSSINSQCHFAMSDAMMHSTALVGRPSPWVTGPLASWSLLQFFFTICVILWFTVFWKAENAVPNLTLDFASMTLQIVSPRGDRSSHRIIMARNRNDMDRLHWLYSSSGWDNFLVGKIWYFHHYYFVCCFAAVFKFSLDLLLNWHDCWNFFLSVLQIFLVVPQESQKLVVQTGSRIWLSLNPRTERY